MRPRAQDVAEDAGRGEQDLGVDVLAGFAMVAAERDVMGHHAELELVDDLDRRGRLGHRLGRLSLRGPGLRRLHLDRLNLDGLLYLRQGAGGRPQNGQRGGADQRAAKSQCQCHEPIPPFATIPVMARFSRLFGEWSSRGPARAVARATLRLRASEDRALCDAWGVATVAASSAAQPQSRHHRAGPLDQDLGQCAGALGTEQRRPLQHAPAARAGRLGREQDESFLHLHHSV